MSELTFNELMTLHMDAIRSKAGTSEKLSIAAATNAINNLTVSFDFSDATAFTSAQLLAGQKGWDRDGNLVTGTMTNHGDYTVTLQETVQTLDSGFYDSITIPAAESGGGDFDFSNATAFTSSQLLDGQKGYNSNGELITGTLEVSAGDNNIIYGVLDADGNFQALDLSGENPVDSGTAESISTLIMYQTGHNEPSYPSGGGGESSGIKFYECTEVDAEGWTGVLMQQDTSTGVWSASATDPVNLTMQHLTPKVGEIYSEDTSIQVRKMFDGTWDYVVYAPLATPSTVTDTGQSVTDIGSPTFGTIANVDCAIFSGSDGIKIPDADIITSGDISICMKVYFNSFNEGALFHIGTASANDLMLFPNGSGSKWSLGTAGGVGKILTVTDTITTNTWMAIAVIKSGSTLQFYRDGNMMYEDEWGITINKNGFIRIGCGYHNGNDTWFFDGSVAELMVFNRALSASEVSQLAQQ